MSEGRWLSGRKEIARYLGVSERGTIRFQQRGAPIVIENGVARAMTLDLDRWIKDRDEGKCPRDGTICPVGRGCQR